MLIGTSALGVLNEPLHDSRLVLLCLVILARRAIFLVENPHGSLIFRHCRFEYLCNVVAWVLQLRMVFNLYFSNLESTSAKHSSSLYLRSIVSHFGWGFWVPKLRNG